MPTSTARRVFAGWMLVLATSWLPAEAGAAGAPLTGPSNADPLDVCLDYLHAQRGALGFAAADLEDVVVTDRYRSARSGLTHLYLRQRIDGIPVEGAEISMAVDADGRLVSLGDRFVRGLAGRVATRRPTRSAAEAVLAAAAHLGIAPTTPLPSPEGAPGSGALRFPGAGISREEIPVALVYVVHEGMARLAWNLRIRTLDGHHAWNLYVDAASARVLRQNDWFTHDSYNVLPPPLVSPDAGPRLLEVGTADVIASPFGWHDADGIAGAEFSDTRGNNVFAQEDIDADDAGGLRPDGGVTLDFDFPLDLTLQPANSIDASVTNLFFWNNYLHDVLYRHGFDAPAGNFQLDNYGAGGAALDPVIADALDGFDTNNARFFTPPDGFAPLMEMFLFVQAPAPQVLVTSPPVIAGAYAAGAARFGAGAQSLAGSVVQALDPADGAGPETTDACSPLTNPGAVAGNLAIIDRGSCDFVVKVAHAQDAGAQGAIIVNNAGEGLVTMLGIDPGITIPSLFLGESDGTAIVGQLGSGVSAELTSIADRDGSFGTDVVVHEYAHGLSNRLTGGPANVNCLDDAESAGMGEGWSDFLGLLFTARSTDLSTDPRGMGGYLIGQGAGGGIRNFPYSTDLVASPLTYGDVSVLNQPHGVGEVWAASLWEVYWNLVDASGFDPDLHTGSGGNVTALQLVVDAMKLQPCDPTFVTGRDALLAADAAANAGLNECAIWEGFAKRGVGLGASDGGSAATLAVTEAFDVPVTCLPEPATTTLLLSGCGLLVALERRRSRRAAQA